MQDGEKPVDVAHRYGNQGMEVLLGLEDGEDDLDLEVASQDLDTAAAV